MALLYNNFNLVQPYVRGTWAFKFLMEISTEVPRASTQAHRRGPGNPFPSTAGLGDAGGKFCREWGRDRNLVSACPSRIEI